MNENDIFLIDKPKGITSYDAIRKLKSKYKNQKMGHAGTLDPNASGLLIVGVGKGTKKLRDIIGLPKVYTAEILLGVKTNTGDITGNVIKRSNIVDTKFNLTGVLNVKKVVIGMAGKHMLPVSLYSAMKQGGRPLYEYARSGKRAIVPKREMEVFEARFIKLEDNVITVEFSVSSGTYIRSLAEEIGKRLDDVTTLKNLRRTKIGEFNVQDAQVL